MSDWDGERSWRGCVYKFMRRNGERRGSEFGDAEKVYDERGERLRAVRFCASKTLRAAERGTWEESPLRGNCMFPCDAKK